MSGVIERYEVQLLNGPKTTCERWFVDEAPWIICGGTVCGDADGTHLVNDLGVQAVLSIETEHDVSPFFSGGVCAHHAMPTQDDGQMKSPAWFSSCVDDFAAKILDTKRKLYLHCQVGGSRTPMMLYAILRRLHHFSPIDALAAIQRVKPSFGTAHYHKNYIASVEIFCLTPK